MEAAARPWLIQYQICPPITPCYSSNWNGRRCRAVYTRMEEPGGGRRSEVLNKILLLSNFFFRSLLVRRGLAVKMVVPFFGQFDELGESESFVNIVAIVLSQY